MKQLADLPQNIKVRLLTSFFNRGASSAVMPFMALFFSQEMGKVWAGMFLIATVIVNFLANLVGGYLSDRFKRKKLLLVTSILSALMFLLMTISLLPKDKWILIFAAAYTGYMIASSLGRPSMQAIIIDSTTSENRKAVYAIDYWLTNLSMAIGAALGGLLYLNHKIELFMLLTIISLLIAFTYKIWLIDTQNEIPDKKHNNVFIDFYYNYKIALQDTRYVKLILGFMFIVSAELSMNSYIGVRLAETFSPINVGDFQIEGSRMLSMLNIENMLLVVFLTFFVTKLTNRFSNRIVLITGLIIYGIGYVFLTSANTLYLLILFSFIATIGELMYSPVYNTEQANLIPADKRGSYSAFAGTAFNGADLISRSSIILGAYVAPYIMSVYIGLIVTAGIGLMYLSIFYARPLLKNKLSTKSIS